MDQVAIIKINNIINNHMMWSAIASISWWNKESSVITIPNSHPSFYDLTHPSSVTTPTPPLSITLSLARVMMVNGTLVIKSICGAVVD